VGIAGVGLVREIEGPLPEHLREWWTHSCSGVRAYLILREPAILSGEQKHSGPRRCL
jgi:hypothetical protein